IIMNKIIFTEEFCQPENLHPFTLTRQIQDIRVGILTIREKWEKLLGLPSFDKKEDDYKDLDRSVNINEAVGNGICFMIHGNVLPTPKLINAISKLKNGEFLASKGATGIVFRFSKKEVKDKHKILVTRAVELKEEIKTIRYPWDIFHMNEEQIREDFRLLTTGRKSQAISKTNKVIKPSGLFIEKGARI